jgi:hypothetical protein
MSKDKQTPQPLPRPRYKITNWPHYNKALQQRGRISLWLPANIAQLWYEQPTAKPIGAYTYCAVAIEFCLTMRQLFGLPYRQTQGFVEDLFESLGLDLRVPSYSQLQRRARQLVVDLKPRGVDGATPVPIVIDSTGLKVKGEGEWKVRKHGKGGTCQWLKLSLVSQPQSLQILACKLTDNDVDDAQSGLELVGQLPFPVASCAADGAYDKKKFRSALAPLTRQLIPPHRKAALSKGPKAQLLFAQRDQVIHQIAATDRASWKRSVGYHQRSKAEVNMFRYKTGFGERIRGRKMVNQVTEVALNCKLLNHFAQLGLPQSHLIVSK